MSKHDNARPAWEVRPGDSELVRMAGDILLEDLDVRCYGCATRGIALIWFTIFCLGLAVLLFLPLLLVLKL